MNRRLSRQEIVKFVYLNSQSDCQSCKQSYLATLRYKIDNLALCFYLLSYPVPLPCLSLLVHHTGQPLPSPCSITLHNLDLHSITLHASPIYSSITSTISGSITLYGLEHWYRSEWAVIGLSLMVESNVPQKNHEYQWVFVHKPCALFILVTLTRDHISELRAHSHWARAQIVKMWYRIKCIFENYTWLMNVVCSLTRNGIWMNKRNIIMDLIGWIMIQLYIYIYSGNGVY